MGTYTVESAEKSKVWTSSQGGQFQSWIVSLIDGQGSYSAEANTRVGNDFPAIGEKVEGDLVPGKFGLQFKRARSAAQSDGYKRDPKETASIVRQHSQHMAVLWLAIQQKQPGVEPNFIDYARLKTAIEWFDRDAKSEPQPS